MRITHAQPLVPRPSDGSLVPEPLLSLAEAELEAKAFGLGEGEIMGEFGTVDGLELGFYTHAIAITSGPEHLCRYYLVRLAR